jgi:S-adenosylmethionine:tRNA ribosyltransferase-isomerase
MKLADFDYQLPPDRIAQHPAQPRDAARMMLLDRSAKRWEDARFCDLPELLRGDELLVVNNTKVIPARLFGRRVGKKSFPAAKSAGAQKEHLSATIEVLLTRQTSEGIWQALVRPGRKVGVGERIVFAAGELEAEVVGRGELGLRELRFEWEGSLPELISRLGHVPLPPYVERADEPADRADYQTIFAQRAGAVAAPTAGLHFTPSILERLQGRGVEVCELTLHVGLGTFQPIHAEEVEKHRMHEEWFEIPEATAEQVRRAKQGGRAVLAVGTTVVRALEDAAQRGKGGGELVPGGAGEASLFIRPGYEFRIVDQMLTNFHLPRSTLLVMVSAFAGRDFILAAYKHALSSGYRFYSYGDCMLIR